MDDLFELMFLECSIERAKNKKTSFEKFLEDLEETNNDFIFSKHIGKGPLAPIEKRLKNRIPGVTGCFYDMHTDILFIHYKGNITVEEVCRALNIKYEEGNLRYLPIYGRLYGTDKWIYLNVRKCEDI